MSTADIIQDLVDDAEELDTDIGNAYDEVQTKGGTVPQNKNTNNLAPAIRTIPTGITPTGTISITQNGTYDVTDYASADVNTNDVAKLLNGQVINIAINEEVDLGVRSILRNQPLLEKVIIKNGGTHVVTQEQFSACPNLEIVDIGGNISRFNNYVFSQDVKFKTLVLRKSSSIVNLLGITVFQSTPFRNGTGGTVYVPQALVSSYQNATNWSALESTTFSAIQESLVALNALGIDITDYYEIVTELPTSDIATDIVYFIETQTAGTYEQWFYGSGSWVQLADITLGGSV